MEQLTPLQTQAVTRLLAGQSVAAVARELQVDRSTIYNWRKQHPYFSYVLTKTQILQAERLSSSLQDLAEAAVDTIRDLMLSTETPAAVRLRAAQAILNSSNHHRHQQQQPSAAVEALIGPPPQPQIQHNSTPFDTPNTPYRRETPKLGRNDLCACGSGLKFKRCCGNSLQTAA
jgi:transposase-like protein